MTSGPLMVDVAGLCLSPEENEILKHPLVGGVILFTRNYESIPQLRDLVQAIKATRNPPLLVAVDQEGGRVQRFRKPFIELPPLRRLGALFANAPTQALDLAHAHGWLMATEILSVGIDISFTPVLDVDIGLSEVIGQRAFASEPQIIVQLARAYIRGMGEAGMAATGKHFPGHGSVKADSHVAIPVDERPYRTIYDQDMVPFRELATRDLAAMMVAHVIYPDKDDKPADFSNVWITEVLRRDLGFGGTVFSDDISMAAASVVGDHAERARLALEAGCDCVVVCNDPEGRATILDRVPYRPDALRQKRLSALYGRSQSDFEALKTNAHWLAARDKLVHLSSAVV